MFSFVEGITIIDFLENMSSYVSDIMESYKDTIIGYLGNIDTADFLPHILQFWRACAVDKENQALPVVL